MSKGWIISGKGLRIGLGPTTITIKDDGTSESNGVPLMLGFDMCPHWIDISYNHLKTALRMNRLATRENATSSKISTLLEKEFIAGMQSITATCTAIDAFFHGALKNLDNSGQLREQWKSSKKGTARYKRVAETLRQAFKLDDKQAKYFKEIIRLIYDFRDRAVHPDSTQKGVVRHPEFGYKVEWRFAAYRAVNAKNALGNALQVIEHCCVHESHFKNKEVASYCKALHKDIKPTIKKWNRAYGTPYGKGI